MTIDVLTAEQVAALDVIRDRWIDIGWSTERADRDAAERGVTEAYAAVGLPAPACVWVDSPLAGAIAATQVRAQAWDQVWDQVRAQVWDQVWDQVRAQVRAQVWDQAWDQVGDQARDQVWDQVRDQVGDQVATQVGDQVRAQVGDQVRAQVGAQVWDQVWRALDLSLCSWSAWADAHESIGVTGLAASKGLRTVAAQSPWWWPMRDIAILTDRPTVMARDNQGRLHNPTGPAIEYADGFGVHAWHGTRVPADLITPGWDLPTALRHDNAEVRRCAIERIAGQDGWAKIITAAGWEQVGDAHPDPGNPGQTLALYHVPAARDGGLYPEPVRLLHCVNATVERDGTRHEFGLTVPAGIGDPVEAAAWTFGLTQNEYARVQRAC